MKKDKAQIDLLIKFIYRWDNRCKNVKQLKAYGYSKEEWLSIKAKQKIRRQQRYVRICTHIDRVRFIQESKLCVLLGTPTRYEIGDWRTVQRPASNNGWVLIALEEPSNNWYTNDKVIVNFLKKKYEID